MMAIGVACAVACSEWLAACDDPLAPQPVAEVPEIQFLVDVSIGAVGEAFDSGELRVGGRSAFVPQVAGAWMLVEEVSGPIGKLTTR